jgi:ATP-dependent DNA helicase RecQ
MESIREVYQCLMNYLQLPAGSGRETYYEFDLKEFTRKFGMDIQQVTNSLNVLQQEEILGMNEQVFLPPTVEFTSSKEGIFQFENSYPAYEPLIKTLLRTYEGIFEFRVAINEQYLAKLMGIDAPALVTQLQTLNRAGIIQYVAQKDKPQIYCYHDRVRTEDLRINLKNLEARKQAFAGRVEKMLQYIAESEECRSRFIAAYFGDEKLKTCGVCDNCLHKKSASLNETEFVDIHMRLLKLLQRPLHSKDVLHHLKGIRKEKAWKVIDHLQAENKIEVDAEGWIKKVK